MNKLWIQPISLAVFMCLFLALPAQNTADTTNQTSTERAFKRIDIFPAISYAPETKLTLGGIGYYYMDFYRGDPTTQLSNVNFLAVYTLNQQIALEGYWDLFSDGNRWRSRGEVFYNKYPDRNYGIGNKAGVRVVEYLDNDDTDTLNYLPFNSDRIKFAPVVLRKIKPNLYVGLQGEMEYLWNEKPMLDRYGYAGADSVAITGLPVDGIRSGVGLYLLYDSRDYVLNPIRGTFLSFGTLHFGRWLGSDYRFDSYRLDARQFINPASNHTIALRAVANLRFSNDPIPMRGLSQVGGRDFIRGYFKGTYQDYHVFALEAEYRLPLWREGAESKLWQVWKRLGLVAFAGGAQVFNEPEDFSLQDMHWAVGGGLRILFNPQTRVNLRIDYAVALDPDSDGDGQRQSGLYFFLSEAF